jgi:hypothetical protein
MRWEGSSEFAVISPWAVSAASRTEIVVTVAIPMTNSAMGQEAPVR